MCCSTVTYWLLIGLKNTPFEAGNRVLRNGPINRPRMLHDGWKPEEMLMRYKRHK
jgi:hypothetical protein